MRAEISIILQCAIVARAFPKTAVFGSQNLFSKWEARPAEWLLSFENYQIYTYQIYTYRSSDQILGYFRGTK
jgi:hypothetical protein